MSLLIWIVLFCLLGGVLSVLAAAVFLLLPQARREAVLPHLVSFATGALLSAAFTGLLPHAMERSDISRHALAAAILAGLLLFFILEKLVIWRHCHHMHCETHAANLSAARERAAGMLIVLGDGIHNFVDGVIIGAIFLTDIKLGVVTSLAVAAHEIPQELGSFAVLLNSGFSRTQAFAWNMIASLTTILGGVLAWASLSQSSAALPYLIAIAVASFIYIAVADLIPGLHESTAPRESVLQVLLIGLGITTIAVAEAVLH
ncbi:MAG TPA: ZIP family metal transporter [Gammaproteobacteria bacterium]|nr:ZIP family metal transporter [Gammaproteobacteria bacterium]